MSSKRRCLTDASAAQHTTAVAHVKDPEGKDVEITVPHSAPRCSRKTVMYRRAAFEALMASSWT